MEFVGQRAAKLLAIKLWEWFDFARVRTRADHFRWGRGRLADFFLRPPTLKASNFEALYSTNPIFTVLKDLLKNIFSKLKRICKRWNKKKRIISFPSPFIIFLYSQRIRVACIIWATKEKVLVSNKPYTPILGYILKRKNVPGKWL